MGPGLDSVVRRRPSTTSKIASHTQMDVIEHYHLVNGNADILTYDNIS